MLDLPRLALAAAVLAVAPGLRAQRPSSWVPAPAAAVQPGAVQHLGKILWFADAGTLHAFSAATRTWAAFPVSQGATIRNTNDWLLVTDGPVVAALSAARGTFDVLTVSPQAFVVNPISARNDGIALVIDGGTLWSFSGFVGRWTSLALPATALVSVQRNVALVADGNQVLGQSALFGDWGPHLARAPVTATGAGDTAGWASDGLDALGFSAIRNRWAAAPLPAGAAASPQITRDAAVWAGSAELLAFSGVRGAFGRVATPGPTALQLADHLAHAVDPTGRQHWLFSVPNADWVALTTAQPATVQLAEAVALLVEPGRAHAYSALTSAIATHQGSAAQTALNAAVAALVDPAGPSLQLFSAITGTWAQAPAAALATTPQLARNGALVRDLPGATAWAFSARSGRFVPTPVGGNPALHVDAGSSLLAVEDDRALAVFDPRREVWLEVPLQPGDRPLALRIWRTTLVAFTPTEAIGYSPMHGLIETSPLPGALLDPRASSEVGAAITQAGVVAYSAVSDLRTESQFPEFRRMFGRGSRVDLEVTGPAGAVFGAVSGFVRGPATAIPGLGELLLDPASLVPIPAQSLDGDGLATLRLPVPDLPGLAGLELAFQGVVVPAAGPAYLTRTGSFRIH